MNRRVFAKWLGAIPFVLRGLVSTAEENRQPAAGEKQSQKPLWPPLETLAAERRRSRVELWNKLLQLRIGFANPQVEGLLVCVASTSPAAEKRISEASLQGFAKAIDPCPQLNVEAVRAVLKDHPRGAGQWGGRPQMYLEGGETTAQGSPIEHGLALRLRLPYAKARLGEIRLNGRPLAASDADGYSTWGAEGLTHIQINIPPSVSRTQDFFLVTGRYDPAERRARGWP